jgi:hypothetical protein
LRATVSSKSLDFGDLKRVSNQARAGQAARAGSMRPAAGGPEHSAVRVPGARMQLQGAGRRPLTRTSAPPMPSSPTMPPGCPLASGCTHAHTHACIRTSRQNPVGFTPILNCITYNEHVEYTITITIL